MNTPQWTPAGIIPAPIPIGRTGAAQGVVARAMPEADLVKSIIDYARYHGYLACHFRPARKKDGEWVTPIQGDKGFPDLVIVRKSDPSPTLWIVEAKSMKGKTTPEQDAWLDALGRVKEVRTAIWTPMDWLDNTIIDCLS